MRLTTKGRYAVTAMLDLALNETDGPVSLAQISVRQAISLSYLEQLFAKLRRNGLVKSVRGPGGGYRLGRVGSEICVAEIVDAVNETYAANACKDQEDCLQGQVCITHSLWNDLSDRIHGFLSGINLQDLVSRQEIQRVSKRQIDRGTARADGNISLTPIS